MSCKVIGFSFLHHQFVSAEMASKASQLEIDYFGCDLSLIHVMKEKPPLLPSKHLQVSHLPNDFSEASRLVIHSQFDGIIVLAAHA